MISIVAIFTCNGVHLKVLHLYFYFSAGCEYFFQLHHSNHMQPTLVYYCFKSRAKEATSKLVHTLIFILLGTCFARQCAGYAENLNLFFLCDVTEF